MILVGVGLLLRCGTRLDAARAAVVADVVFGDMHDRGVVGIVNDGRVHVIHIGVVSEVATFPAAAFISKAAVPIAVIDAAVVANLRAPISFIENERVAAPAPITRSPEEAYLGWLNPRAGHPEITTVVKSPVARRPEVTVGGADRLLIDGKRGRSKAHGNADAELGGRTVRKSKKDNRKQQQANGDRGAHCDFLRLTYLFRGDYCVETTST